MFFCYFSRITIAPESWCVFSWIRALKVALPVCDGRPSEERKKDKDQSVLWANLLYDAIRMHPKITLYTSISSFLL